MGTLRLILGDQLTRGISALDGLDKDRDVVLLAEVREEGTYVRHHKQKIALILSAMRHFAEALRHEGIKIDYIRLDDPENTGLLTGELARALQRHRLSHAVMTEPGNGGFERLFSHGSATRERISICARTPGSSRAIRDSRDGRMAGKAFAWNSSIVSCAAKRVS